MNKWMLGAGMAMTAMLGAAAQAQAQTPWIHVQVNETHSSRLDAVEHPSKVNVNLPLSLVEVALDAAPERIASHGHVHLGPNGHDLSVADLRKIWKELGKAGDADLVTVEGENETVKVARQGDLLRIRVEKAGKTEEVNVEIPAAVLDALLSSEGESLNVRAALQQLSKLRGDLVRVHDGKSNVRVWIDERS